ATVIADQLIAKIDTEAVAGAAAPAPAPVQDAQASAGATATPAAAAATGGSKSGVAMPAAAKLLSENNRQAANGAGTGKDGRVTKGDALAAVASGAKPAAAAPVSIPTGVPTTSLPQVAAPAVDLGNRPEQRVPMTRLRARIAERLLQSQATNAILTT